MCSSVQYLQETNDAAANDANEAIPEDQLDQMRALGMYGLMVCTLTGMNSAELPGNRDWGLNEGG